MTLTVSHPRAKQRWALLVVGVVAIMLALVSMTQGLTQAEFELDKNATNDLTTLHQGTLKGQLSNSATTFDVCQLLANPANGSTILIDSERMTNDQRRHAARQRIDQAGWLRIQQPGRRGAQRDALHRHPRRQRLDRGLASWRVRRDAHGDLRVTCG